MKQKKTPGSTPGKTPKGFRALFSLWEGKRESRSPLRRGKSANQADVPEVASSPLRPLGDLPHEASETPNQDEPMLNASSPAMLMAARALLSSSFTWSATPEDSTTKQHITVASDILPDKRVPDEVVNHDSVEVDLGKDHNLRLGNSDNTPTMGSGARPSTEEPSLRHNLSTPQVAGDRPASNTPTEIGLTPPTLSAHNPFPAGAPAVACASDDCSSEAGMSSKFSTCDEGSVEQSPGGSGEMHRLQHAGHTPAPRLPASQTPCPPSEGALPAHHVCDADLDRSASGAEMILEPADEMNAPPACSMPDVNVLDAPLCSQPEACHAAPSCDVPPLPEPHARPEVSSPIIESLERSGGSDALARAGSSGMLRSGSSGVGRAAAGPSPSGDAPVRHRHQRSGALDFDSALLLTSVEDGNADVRVSPVEPALLEVCAGGQDGADDVRGSDDSVLLHPTPGASKQAGNIAAALGEGPMDSDAALCPVGHGPPASSILPADATSPGITDAAPPDGMVAVAPLAMQPLQHTAPATAAEDSTHFLPDLLPGTPSPSARGTDDAVMAGVTPVAHDLEQDSIMVATTPIHNSGHVTVCSPMQPIAHAGDISPGSPGLNEPMYTLSTDQDVPMGTPSQDGAPATAEPGDCGGVLDTVSQTLLSPWTAAPTEVMTDPNTSMAACLATPETEVVPAVDEGAPHVPGHGSLTDAVSPAPACDTLSQAATPKAADALTASAAVPSPVTEYTVPPVPVDAADSVASLLTTAECQGPSEISVAAPQPGDVGGMLVTPAGAHDGRPVEGTPHPSITFAPHSVQCVSTGDTPTEVQLSRCRGLIADGTSAFQVLDDPITPTSANPADDSATVGSGVCNGEDADTANDESVPLSGGSVPLAMAPTDRANLCKESIEATVRGAQPAEAADAALPMLSPVQADGSSPAAADGAAAMITADFEANICEALGGDENVSSAPLACGATPLTSRFQVPIDADAQEDIADAQTIQEQLVDDAYEIDTEVCDAGGASEEVPADLAMECSDAVVEHDEDSCTRVESPVPPAVAATGALGGADASHEEEDLLTDSRKVISAVAMPRDFTMCSPLQQSTGVRESTDSKYAPSGTDSILGIASGICSAAVAGALTSSTSLRNSQGPLSPRHTDCSGEPGRASTVLMASPLSEAPRVSLERGEGVNKGSTPGPGGHARDDVALGSAEVLPTPPDGGRPSLRRARETPSETPRDTILHPISSESFRVTDSCADRVWRMLQGAADGAAAATAPPSMTPTAEDMLDGVADDGMRHSLAVPDFPSLDEAAYAQLEREALHASDSAAELPLPPIEVPAAAERPSTPPAPLHLAVPQSGTNPQSAPGDSPSLQPTFCESPGLPARRSSRCSGSASQKVNSNRGTPLSAQVEDDLRQTAITDTLVNQSLTASLMFPGGNGGSVGGEILLESMLDGDSAEPEALPSPTQLDTHKSPLDPSPAPPSAERGSVSHTGPQNMVGAGSSCSARRRVSTADEAERSCPATSTFDAAAIVSDSEKRRTQRRQSAAERPKSAGARHITASGPRSTSARPSTSSGVSNRRASQTSSLSTPLTAQHHSANPAKRSLSHKTIHNITPNHNPNYRPHSPGKTPQAVPPNPSPYAKRCRSHGADGAQRLDQPLDIGCDLPDVDDIAVLESTGAKNAARGQKVPGSEGLTAKVTPPLARPARQAGAERRGGPPSAQNLRDSLLTLDPMRLSYGPDGLVNLAGDEDKVLFQADIEAITQALDTYPSQGDVTNENSSAQPRRPGDSAAPRRGISPLRLSSVLKQRTPGSDYPKVVGADCDVEDLRLQLAVAVRQAEHFRRENATLQERNSRLQEYIEAETFLGSGQDNTETLLAEVSPEARKEEVFASERSELQVQVSSLKSKCEDQRQQMHVLLTQQLPAAHAAAERAEKELAAERARSAAAAEAASTALAQEQSRLKQAKHEAGKLRTDLERHAARSAEATQSRRRLEDALAQAQAATEAAEGRYQIKCKELAKTKLSKPTGIGGGIGAPKLKQDLSAMTAERDAVKAKVRELQEEVGHLTRALHAKESEYEQLSQSFHQALSRWELRSA